MSNSRSISRRTALRSGLAAGLLAPGFPTIQPARAAGADTATLRAVMQGDLRVVRSDLDHGEHDRLPRRDGLRHAVRHRRAVQPQPQMVGKYGLSDDKLTYTFELRDGLRLARRHAGHRRRRASPRSALGGARRRRPGA